MRNVIILFSLLTACLPPRPQRPDSSEKKTKTADLGRETVKSNVPSQTPPDSRTTEETPSLPSTPSEPSIPSTPGSNTPTPPRMPTIPSTMPPQEKPALTLENGVYTIQNLASKKCLEVTSAANGTSIIQFGCNGQRIQAFKFESIGERTYKIVNVETRKAFDIKGASKSEGAELLQYDYANAENQAFVIDHDASIEDAVNIRPKHSQKFLEVPEGTLKSKASIEQGSENKEAQQKWKLTKIKEPTQAAGVRYTFVNECDHEVWVASQNNPGYPVVKGDFKLGPGEWNQTDTNAKWEGRFWGRYNCKMVNGKLQCESGHCAKGEICGDVYGEPPVAIAEFRTRGYEDIDFYDISLVDGTNLPMDIRPMPLTLRADGAKGSCKHLECKADLRIDCPAELQKKNVLGQVIGCKSACEAFKTDEYCCLGAFRAPNCKPSTWAKWFDNKCPDAYSFAEDTKTFTCRDADYEVIFCPK